MHKCHNYHAIIHKLYTLFGRNQVRLYLNGAKKIFDWGGRGPRGPPLNTPLVTVPGFPVSLFDRLAFSIPAFSVAPVLTQTNRVLEVARIFTKHSKYCDEFFVLTMSFYAFISLLYRQLLLQKTLLKSIYVPSALLTKLTKKFHTKLLASAFILESQNCPRKHFALMPPCFI